MTTAVLMVLSLYNLISSSSQQLKRINLYKYNLISLAKYFPVLSLYSEYLLNIDLFYDSLLISFEMRENMGPKGTQHTSSQFTVTQQGSQS